jgi:hypothetical protein
MHPRKTFLILAFGVDGERVSRAGTDLPVCRHMEDEPCAIFAMQN